MLNELCLFHTNLLDLDVVSGTNEELHLHGLNGDQGIVGLDFLTHLAIDLDDRTGHGALNKILFIKHQSIPLRHIIVLLLVKFQRCTFRVEAENLIGLFIEHVGNRELLAVSADEQLSLSFRVDYNLSVR